MSTIGVVTNALLTFEVEGTTFDVDVRAAPDTPPVNVATIKDGPMVVAVFTDVHAVFYKDSGKLITEGDE